MSAALTSNASSPLTSSHSYDDALDTFANTISSNIITNSNQFSTLSSLTKSASSSTASSSSASSPTNQNNPSSSLSSSSTASKQTQMLIRKEKPTGEQVSSSLMCQICKSRLNEPKLLNCLHSFCFKCLVISSTGECGDMPTYAINCPKCKQETIIPNGIENLEDDYVMQNILDMIAIEEMILSCTSCKTDEKAVARCADCAQFLCPNCVSAHQYMRCFENHRVDKFQDILRLFKQMNDSSTINTKERHSSYSTSSTSCSSSSTCSNSSNEYLNEPNQQQQQHHLITNGLPIHKPIFCKSHPKENLKFFCNNCQIPICTDCIVSTHPSPMHHYERLTDCETKNIDELESLIRQLKEKINEFDTEYQLLDQCLSDLQENREQSKGLIEETFQSYKEILERQKENLLKELLDKHRNKEFSIMDLHQSFKMSAEQLNEVIQFVERVLKNGNCSEISLLKSLILNQSRFLINNIPLTDNIDVNLKFITDDKRFEKAIQETFGRFQTQKEIRQNYFNNLTSSTSQNESLMLAGKLSGEQQRLQQIQKQLEQQQHNNNFKPAQFQTNLDQEWLLNMMNNQYSKQLNGYTQFDTPNDLQQSPNDDWLKQQQQHQLNKSLLNEAKQKRASMSPESSSSTSSNTWFNPSRKTNLINSNNYLNVPKQPAINRPQSPLQLDTNLVLNQTNAIQQHQLFLQQQHQQLSNSRCQTPASQLYTTKHAQLQNDLVAVTNALNISSNLQNIQNICLPTNNQLVVNGLDEYMPFGQAATTSSMAQNFNQLSKLITNQHITQHRQHQNDLNQLNLNEFQLGQHNQNGFQQDVLSNPSQSPTLAPIGSQVNQFSGNGNLNPPVRQTGQMKNMTIRTKFGLLGAGKSQFNSPHGFCLGVDEEIIVADTNNHRIQVFDKKGEFKYCFGSPGREEGQLWYPRKVIVMRDSGKFVICDRGSERSRMQIFNRTGHFIKKIAIRYIDIVAGLAVTQQGEIVAVDSVSPTVFRISEAGELIKWFDCSDHMREPSDIAINGNEYYVCDFKGHCVVVFSDEGNFIRRIGGENITNFPNGIEVSDEGDVLVGDSHGNRFHVAVYSRSGDLLSEFECPYVKVSRCCGLKITSEGHVVTLAKNNHHVLVLNTLYVQ